MRIVGGRLRGRALAAPKSQTIRPTADRLRESLFNILAARLRRSGQPARACSIFSPAPARSASRRCRAARHLRCSSTTAPKRARCCARTSTSLGLGGVARIFRRDATKLGPAHPLEPFSLAFLDPPYGQGSPNRPSSPHAPEDGSRPTRSSSWRKRRMPRISRRPRDLPSSNGAATTIPSSFLRPNRADAEKWYPVFGKLLDS